MAGRRFDFDGGQPERLVLLPGRAFPADAGVRLTNCHVTTKAVSIVGGLFMPRPPRPTCRLLGGFLHLGTKMKKIPTVANDNVDSVRLFAGNVALALDRADVDAALSGFVVAMAEASFIF